MAKRDSSGAAVVATASCMACSSRSVPIISLAEPLRGTGPIRRPDLSPTLRGNGWRSRRTEVRPTLGTLCTPSRFKRDAQLVQRRRRLPPHRAFRQSCRMGKLGMGQPYPITHEQQILFIAVQSLHGLEHGLAR